MRLEYNILWIDNDLQGYVDNGSIRSIEEFLSERGFEPTIEKVFDEADLDKFISIHNYDLIISDYNLNNTTGDKVIQEIREVKKLDTDILFYTAKASYKNNPEVKDRLAFIERLTFQVGRDTLLDKIEKVIKITLKKLLELNATRGLVTAETSELDVTIEEIVMDLIYNKLKLDIKEIDKIVNFYIEDFLRKSPESFLQKYKELGFEKRFHSIEAARKWHIFRDLLKQIKNEEIRKFLELNKPYCDEVIIIRNKFAHAKALKRDGKLYLAGMGPEGKAFEFNEDQCIEIRKKLIGHRKNFDDLKKHLGINTN
jgi:CheY-like chemotaxis protein